MVGWGIILISTNFANLLIGLTLCGIAAGKQITQWGYIFKNVLYNEYYDLKERIETAYIHLQQKIIQKEMKNRNPNWELK